MITASVADDDRTAAENSLVYPLLFIAGIRIDPSAAASATADPEISAKNIEVTTVTCASAPRTKPSSAEESAIRRREIPEAFMIAPASTNRGMAISGKLVAPVYMTMGTFGSCSIPPVCTMATSATTASETAMGTFSSTSAITAAKRTRMAISASAPARRGSAKARAHRASSGSTRAG